MCDYTCMRLFIRSRKRKKKLYVCGRKLNWTCWTKCVSQTIWIIFVQVKYNNESRKKKMRKGTKQNKELKEKWKKWGIWSLWVECFISIAQCGERPLPQICIIVIILIISRYILLVLCWDDNISCSYQSLHRKIVIYMLFNINWESVWNLNNGIIRAFFYVIHFLIVIISFSCFSLEISNQYVGT